MGWYDAAWPNRIKITIDKTKVGLNITGYPVYVDLSNLPAGFHSKVKSDGGDIRVTSSDGTTELAREIVYYDAATDTGELWIKANVATGYDLDLYIYYGNSSASDYAETNTYGAHSVWDADYSNYVRVYHMHQDPSGSAPQLHDSTSNNSDATSQGTFTSADLITDGLGKSIRYNGSSQWTQLSYGGYAGSCAIQCRLKLHTLPTTLGRQQVIIQQAQDGDGIHGWGMLISASYIGSDNVFYASCVTESPSAVQYTATEVAGTSIMAINQWIDVMAVFDNVAKTLKLFVNGSEVASVGTGTQLRVNANYSHLCCWKDGIGPSLFLDGLIDEARYSQAEGNTYFNANRATTERNNFSSPNTFYSVGTEESGAVVRDIIGNGLIAFPR